MHRAAYQLVMGLLVLVVTCVVISDPDWYNVMFWSVLDVVWYTSCINVPCILGINSQSSVIQIRVIYSDGS